jgi:excisionase family DNA binding protein
MDGARREKCQTALNAPSWCAQSLSRTPNPPLIRIRFRDRARWSSAVSAKDATLALVSGFLPPVFRLDGRGRRGRRLDEGAWQKGGDPASADSRSKIPPPDVPLWAAAEVSRVHRSRPAARRQSDQSESQSAQTRLRAAAESQEPPRRSGQCVAAGRAFRPEPLLTVGETATILNVSERTVRRLIASKAIRVVLIGRSVRLRPRDIARLIAEGGVCND